MIGIMSTRSIPHLGGGGVILIAAAVLFAAGMPDDASAQLRDPSGDILISSILGHGPQGLWSDGKTMWGPDTVNDMVYAYNLTTKHHDPSKSFSTYNTDNNSPVSVWSDGHTMWVADVMDSKIYAYNLTTRQHDSSKDFGTLAAAGNDYLRGIWSDGQTMWVSDSEDSKIYAYNMGTRQHDSSKDFGTLAAAGNNDPRGIWSDGQTMWVVDVVDSKIYAYNMSTKQHDSSKDLGTLATNGITYPYGVWSNGSIMWVSDTLENAIYAYDTSLDSIPSNSTGEPPVADAGAGQVVVRHGESVVLDGTGSSDPDGDALTYSWMLARGAGPVTLSNSTAPSTTFTAPDPNQTSRIVAYPAMEREYFGALGPLQSDLIFMLTVSDGLWSAIDTIVVSVLPSEPPTSAGITQVYDGTKWVPFAEGMVIPTDRPKFTGTSDGIESVQVLLCDQQVGKYNGIAADGTFRKGQKTPLEAGTCQLVVKDCGTPQPGRLGQCALSGADPSEFDVLFNSTVHVISKTVEAADAVEEGAAPGTINEAPQPKSAGITQVYDGTKWVPFAEGMIIPTDRPKFTGTSDGIESVQVLLCDQQVGKYNGIAADGTFRKGQKTPLDAGTCQLVVKDCGTPQPGRLGQCALSGADPSEFDVLFTGTVHVVP